MKPFWGGLGLYCGERVIAYLCLYCRECEEDEATAGTANITQFFAGTHTPQFLLRYEASCVKNMRLPL
jgi:hypothetical protein